MTADTIQYRGLIINLFKLKDMITLDKGSSRLSTFIESMAPRLELFILFVYKTDADVNVEIKEGSGSRLLRRFYTSSKFPFLHRRPSRNAYKTLFYDFRFFSQGKKKRSVSQYVIKNQGSLHVIATRQGIQPNQILHNLDGVKEISNYVGLDGKDENVDERLAIIEQSLLRLMKQGMAREAAFQLVRFYCSHRINHRSVFKILSKFNFESLKNDKDKDALELGLDIDKLLRPYRVGRHGYKLAFQFADLTELENEIALLCRTLHGLGVQPIINSGTLLGYIRNGGPILHDDDLDLAVILPGSTPDESAKIWNRFIKELPKDYAVVPKGAFFSIFLKSGFEIDVFPAWIAESRLFVYPYCWGDVEASDAVPIEWKAFRGEPIPLPRSPEKLLSVNYGPNWKIPDPYWRFDYKLSQKRFKNVLPLFRLSGGFHG